MAKARRVHEIAKTLGVKSKAIVDRCEAEGIPAITNHMSSVSAHLEATIMEWFAASDREEETGGTAVETAAKVDLTKARIRRRALAKRCAVDDEMDQSNENVLNTPLVKRRPSLSAPRESSECTSQRTGVALSTFLSRVQAQLEADHIRHKRDKDLVPYKCDRCDGWHLCPRDRYTPSTRCEQCNKDLYEMEEYAERRAEILGVGLRVYRCPYGYGWHLTSKV
jgi:hypothetical protein